MNKKHLLIRIITLPLKIIFSLIWYISICLISNYKWLLYGGQELIYFKKEFKGSLEELISSNEKLVELLKNK